MSVHKNIKKSSTLNALFYQSLKDFDQLADTVFLKSWQFIDLEITSALNQFPFLFLEPIIPEPLILVNQPDSIHCMSNVCTHRGNLLVHKPQKSNRISCNYHGRCFDLMGSFKSMPAFEQVEGFPSKEDSLMQFGASHLGPIYFAQLEFGSTFTEWIKPVVDMLPWFPFDKLQSAPTLNKNYSLDAHWCLYVDNYLEGFHVPFVHPALNESLDMKAYETKIYDKAVLQIGRASNNEACFDIPSNQPYHAEQIYAFYFWLFPNIMINVYPWGISLNQIIPVSLDQTIIKFRSFVLPGADPKQIARTAIDETEMEDEEVVLQVQQGLKSRYYRYGRFSPTMEMGVHHFHLLLTNALKN